MTGLIASFINVLHCNAIILSAGEFHKKANGHKLHIDSLIEKNIMPISLSAKIQLLLKFKFQEGEPTS